MPSHYNHRITKTSYNWAIQSALHVWHTSAPYIGGSDMIQPLSEATPDDGNAYLSLLNSNLSLKQDHSVTMQEFYKIVDSATEEQRKNMAELTGSAFGDAPDTLCNHVRYLRAGSLGQLFWNDSWKQVVTDVADHIGIDWTSALGSRSWGEVETPEIEAAVVTQLFQNALAQLSPEQRQTLVMEMQRSNNDPHLESFLLSGSAMAVAKMSGFGVYLLASTVLSGLTSTFGITLPFAIYIGMSQTIALMLGPIGWIALTGGILFTFNQPNWNRLTLAVVYVSMLRYSA